MIHFLHLRNYPIYDQLLLEEALLRTDQHNWCLINEGSPVAIVMGISGKEEELIDVKRANCEKIPIIKRFSGGGTVIVDEHTLFTTFIFQKDFHPFQAYPEPILKWSEEIFKPAFDLDLFHLRENDFAIGDKKCGGNAKYIKKDRWLLHTSFLWDYRPERMDVLLYPKKTPRYRDGRAHHEFLAPLCKHVSEKATLIDGLKEQLRQRYGLREISLESALEARQGSYRQATVYTFQ